MNIEGKSFTETPTIHGDHFRWKAENTEREHAIDIHCNRRVRMSGSLHYFVIFHSVNELI